LTDLNWTYFPYSFFNFDSDQIKIDYSVNGVTNYTFVSDLPVKNMQMQLGPNNESATIIVSRGNDLFNYTQFTTIYQGSKFVNLTATVDSTVNGISLNYLTFQVESKGTIIQLSDNTVAWIDQGVKAFGQLIFYGNKPDVSQTLNNPPPYNVNVQYALNGSSQAKIEFSATTYSVTDNLQFYTDQATIDKYFAPIIAANLAPQQLIGNSPITTFDYQTALKQYSISYIANRNTELNPKFAKDPTFSLVFINSEVAFFKVNADANPVG
jgi:hypothetical protein